MSFPAGPSTSPADVVACLRAVGCVFAEREADLLVAAARDDDELGSLVRRRVSGLPLEHVLGWAEFCGLRVSVDCGVFVPRRRTEFMVEQAVALVQPGDVVLDMCCGSAAVGLAIAASIPSVVVYAADVDQAAVRCATRNLAPVGGQVFHGDLFRALPASLLGSVSVLVANAPYVPTDAIALMPPEARLYEPRVALDGGGDGLRLVRRVVAEAPRWLATGGHLLVESSRAQAPTVVAECGVAGLSARVMTSAERDATVVVATAHSR